MESDLADHIKSLAACYHGLSKDKCKSLAYEFAVSNDVAVPDSWKKNKKAGRVSGLASRTVIIYPFEAQKQLHWHGLRPSIAILLAYFTVTWQV